MEGVLDPMLRKELGEAKAALARHGIVILRGVESELEPAIMIAVRDSLASSPGKLKGLAGVALLVLARQLDENESVPGVLRARDRLLDLEHLGHAGLVRLLLGLYPGEPLTVRVGARVALLVLARQLDQQHPVSLSLRLWRLFGVLVLRLLLRLRCHPNSPSCFIPAAQRWRR